MTPNTAPTPLGVDDLLPLLLAALRAPATVPADTSSTEAVLHLSHGLVGAAEIQAAAGEAFAAAGADTRTEVLGHVQWRAMRLVQGVRALLDEIGEDPVLRTALISAAATAALLSARASTTLPGSRDDAISSIRKAGQALDMAAAQARRLR